MEDDIVIENGECVLADPIDMGEFDQYDIVWDGDFYEEVSHGYADDGEIYGNEFPDDESEYPFGILPAIGTIKGYPDGEHHIKISGIHIEKMDQIFLDIDIPDVPVRRGSGANSVESGSAEASGALSHAEGLYAKATGYASHAEGVSTKAEGDQSHAEGNTTQATGYVSHAEGYNTQATGDYSHAEGSDTTASQKYSHAEGWHTTAGAQYSHAEGYNTLAFASGSHAEGMGTKTRCAYSHAQGKYNVDDTEQRYADIVGWGTTDFARKNISSLTTTGDLHLAGDVYVGANADGTGGTAILTSSAIYVQASDDATKMMKITVASDGTITATQVTA